MSPPLIHVDVETRSAINLAKRGADVYAEDDSTDVLCVCWKVDGDKDVWSWVPGDPIPDVFLRPYVMGAHNAAFERVIFEHVLHTKYGFDLPDYYVCTMAMCAVNNLPLSLDAAAAALGLSVRKDKEGKVLMLELCRPKQPDPCPLFEDAGIELDESDDPAKIRRLIEYCKQDVVVEVEIHKRLRISDFEQRVYNVDQKINSRGIKIDTTTVKAVERVVAAKIDQMQGELREITGGEVTSAAEIANIKKWLAWKGVDLPDLRAETVDSMLSSPQRITKLPADCRRVLEIRQASSLASLKKLPAMLQSVSKDNRARGLFLYCGASSTGRWTSRRIQLQNMPRLSLTDAEVKVAVDLFRQGDVTGIELFFGDVIHVAKQMLRPMLHSDNGMVVGDWSKIELCVAAWVSGQDDLVEELRTGVDTYKSMASHIYHVKYEDVTKDQRHIGKCAVLGCGYGLGASTFLRTLLGQGVDADEQLASRAVDAFRKKNHRFTWIWSELTNAAIRAIDYGKQQNVGEYLAFAYNSANATLMMRLPSGRIIHYYKVAFESGEYGREITCTNWDKQGARKKLYGGLFFENACQGIARDLLAETLVRGDKQGFRFIGSTHDEVVVENTNDAESLRELMETVPEWAAGLPLKAECFSCHESGNRYTK